MFLMYSKTCVKWPLSKRLKIVFQDQVSLNAGQKYCRMLQGENSAILSTFIRLTFVIKIFVLLLLSGHFTQALLYSHWPQSEGDVKSQSRRFSTSEGPGEH